MRRKIIISVIIIIGGLFFSGILDGYYYKTDYVIGDKTVYGYDQVLTGQCKCMNLIYFYEDEDYKYYVTKSGCPKETYYLKVNGKYITLKSAVEQGIIEPREIFDSKLNYSKEEK